MSLVFLDTETTGLNPDLHEVWEIAYAVEDGPINSGFVLHNAVGVDPQALAVNGYLERFHGDDHFKNAIRFELKVREALSGAEIVASNPPFDRSMLRARWGVEPWHHRSTDISSYAKPLYGELLGLYKIAERLDIDAPDHTAAQDVATLRACYRALESIYAKGFGPK